MPQIGSAPPPKSPPPPLTCFLNVLMTMIKTTNNAQSAAFFPTPFFPSHEQGVATREHLEVWAVPTLAPHHPARLRLHGIYHGTYIRW